MANIPVMVKANKQQSSVTNYFKFQLPVSFIIAYQLAHNAKAIQFPDKTKMERIV